MRSYKQPFKRSITFLGYILNSTTRNMLLKKTSEKNNDDVFLSLENKQCFYSNKMKSIYVPLRDKLGDVLPWWSISFETVAA